MTHTHTPPTHARIGDELLWHGGYVDGSHGQYAPDRLAFLADWYAPNPLGRQYHTLTMTSYRARGDWDAYYGYADEMLHMLNGVTTDGVWYWWDGELYLSGVSEMLDMIEWPEVSA